MKLAEEKIIRRDNSTRCPICGREDFDDGFGGVGDFEVVGSTAYQRCTCKYCGARWTDAYEMSRTIVEEVPDDYHLRRLALAIAAIGFDPDDLDKKDVEDLKLHAEWILEGLRDNRLDVVTEMIEDRIDIHVDWLLRA